MQLVSLEGFDFYIKRDDLLNQHFSGNKARKFSYFLENNFSAIKRIIGHGSAQANSLYSLAALAKIKGWQLDFYVSHIAPWLKENPNGNYRAALALGANVIEVDKRELQQYANLDCMMRAQYAHLNEETLFVPEGGRCQQAKQGVGKLAQEINTFCREHKLNDPLVMLPSGTGTTSLFLQAALPYQVVTCACVGDTDYLRSQFAELEVNCEYWPTILQTEKKYHFGKLYPEFYTMWQKAKQQTGIEFDLLYDPLGWLTLLDYLHEHGQNRPVIYIHQGGLVGNESMLPRYTRKYPAGR
ncbi:pyridoxal-phosphate dependent enzyme [Psychromonas sp. MME2]|uniref:pyridoxal-phosphate dependent enzyme n=1 Tax=unclassified Psychromonas TaxID=2614957 RepID=UPI00339CA293